MQSFDLIFQIVLYSLCISVFTAYMLYRRLSSPSRTAVRVHYVGGSEKRYDAVEVENEVVWIEAGEELRSNIPLTVQPSHDTRFGVHYRVYDQDSGADEVMEVPWMKIDPETAIKLRSDAAMKERYRRRTRAFNSFKQAIAGLSEMNRWQFAFVLISGVFIGLYLAPLINKLVFGS